MQAIFINDFDDSWHDFIKRFTVSVQHIIGQPPGVRSGGPEFLLGEIEEEMEVLRSQVDNLNDEVSFLDM